jgi:DNA-binding transcriptional regulator YdaS (Cro superfamily)
MGNESTIGVEAMQRAVAIKGSQPKLAADIGYSQMSVSRWVNGEVPVAAEAVLKIEAATGVSRHDLRPDLYPREPVLHESRR